MFLKIKLIIVMIIGPITNLFTFIKPPDFVSSTSNLSNKTIPQIQLFQRNTIQRSSPISQRDNFECVNITLNDNTKVYLKLFGELM